MQNDTPEITALERAIRENPRDAGAHHDLGHVLLQLRRYQQARGYFERALELSPKLAETHNALGALLHLTGDLEGAVASYRRALMCRPDFADAVSNLGITLRETGELDAAIACFERAILLNPRNGSYYRGLVSSRAEAPDSPHIPAMERLLEEFDDDPIQQRIELHFALAKAYEDVARFDDAFTQLARGNTLRREQSVYDESRELAAIDAIPQAFSRSFISSLRGIGNPSPRPIFIFGMPRSGTTLVEQILAAHPLIHAAGELEEFERAFQAAPKVGLTHTLEDLRNLLRAVGERYLDATAALAPDNARHVTDKLPRNALFAGLISLALPNARMIHVRRDALDTCFSCYANYFTDPLPQMWDLAEIGHFYRAHERLMRYWHEVLPPDRLLEVGYEELVEDFEVQARRIAAFCNLSWSAKLLDFHRVRRPVRTASQVQVRRPLFKSSIGRARLFESHLQPLIDALI